MNEYEHTLIGKIVKVVSNKINQAPLHVVDYPVGLESRVHIVNSHLNEACDDGVCMIGIHGTGGIGKSTLARAVYNFIADQFECLCFLHDVRENSVKHGLEHLQEEILYKTIGLQMKIGGVNEGIGIIKERLRQKKVLLILDDVDELKQLNFLAGGVDWFGHNSRVIITTRDKSLLTRHMIERTYEVDGLNKGESLELFKRMAFKTKKVDSINDDIVNRAITYASGLPLAIDVIGSNLSGKPIAEWKSMLDQYKRIPPKDIQNILKVSFDDLDEESKNVFLDIACFFKGCRLEEFEGILNAHYGYCIKHHVGVLVDKSLTKFQNGFVRLHDLIEDMGKAIVRKESPDHPEKRTRLWFNKDIVEVLEENKGTGKTKMIYLDCPSEEVSINWNGKGFKKMTNLKTLFFKNVNFSKGSRYFPSSLRVLEWEKYPSTPFSIMNKKFDNMKVLKFDNCEHLTKISNVSYLQNLEEFSFENCENLITIDNSIGFLSKLEILNAKGCTNLRSFPPLKLPSLLRLNLDECHSLEDISAIPPNLQILYALNCKSLNSSSKSMLLNKSGKTQYFCFPSQEGGMIPEWFKHQSRGGRFPFWFRNKLPSIMLLCSTNSKRNYEPDFDVSSSGLSICINDFRDVVDLFSDLSPSHTYLFDLIRQEDIEFHDSFLDYFLYEPKLIPKLVEAFEKNEWISAEIKFKATFHLYFKEKNNVDHIRFTNPYRKRKLNELHL